MAYQSSALNLSAEETGAIRSRPVHRRSSHASQAEENDDADKTLAVLGYNAVFKREFTLWSCFSFALSISGLFGTVITTFSYGLSAGGGAAVVWSWLVGGVGAMCLALSIAEITSAYPTSGGMYFTLKFLAPPSWVPVIAWLVGWLNLIGQICGSASSEYGAAQLLLAAVSVASDFNYFPTQGHIVGVVAALTTVHGLINSLPTRWLHHIAKSYAVLHIAVLVTSCIVLLVMQKDKSLGEQALKQIVPEPASGWSPSGFSFLFGFLSVAWCMTDYDATSHIAEEARNPSHVVPKAIASALGFTYAAGWLLNLILVLCMGDYETLLESPIGQPVVQLFYDVMGKGAAIFFTVAAFLVMNFVCITAMQAGSRTVWAFSRDQLLPGSWVWFKIWKLTDTPVLAVWLYVLLNILINLIALASTTAVGAIFNTCAIALDWSYCIPLICKLAFGRFEKGPWNLGKAGPFINAWAVIWTAFLSVIFVFPTAQPVTPSNMNYAVVILAFVFLVAVVYWIIHGRYYYTGPRTQAHVVEGSIINAEISKTAMDQEKGPEEFVVR